MRSFVPLLVGLLIAAPALAQMGPEMGMGMGPGMGMGGFSAPALVDTAPVFSLDGKSITFCRVHATFQGTAWAVASSMGGGMGMGMGAEMGMGPGMGPGMGMGMGMGMGTGPDLSKEGIFQAGASGGQARNLVSGRALIQDVSQDKVCYVMLGSAQGYGQQGIFGMSTGGGGNSQWYPATMPWVRLSPNGNQFVIPWAQGKAVVFFPAQGNAQQNEGYCLSGNLKVPASWTNESDGVYVIEQKQAAGPMMGMGMGAEMGMGAMGPGMGAMGPGMGAMGPGMGMGGFAAANIAVGKADQSVTVVVKQVNPDSFAIRIPGSTDIAVYLAGGQGAGTQGKTWPGAKQGLYVYGQDGSEKTKLTSEKVRMAQASPDGKYVAFTWGDKAPLTLSVAAVDGSPVKRVGFSIIGSISGSLAFAWAPDSKSVAFGAEDDGGNGIFVANVQTGVTSRVSTIVKPEEPEGTGE